MTQKQWQKAPFFRERSLGGGFDVVRVIAIVVGDSIHRFGGK